MDRQPSYGALVTRHQPGLERQREPTVKAASPLPRQRPADGFVHEGVGERETLGQLSDQTGGERLVQGVEHAGATEITGLAEEVDGKSRPDRRGHGEDVPAGAAHQGQPAEHDGPHTRRHLESPRDAHPGIVELTPRHQQTDQLDHEERVPARPPVQRLAGGRRGLGPLDGGDESTHLGRGQPVQLDHGRAGPTSQLGHRLPECGVGAGRWGAVGGDEQERSAAGFPGDELEQPQRPRSASWRSSNTMAKGWWVAAATRNRVTASNIRNRDSSLAPGVGTASAGRRARSSGTRDATSAAPIPNSAASRTDSTRSRWLRSACDHGQKAGASRPPAVDHRTSTPWSVASDANSSTRRVLPMPGSPQIRATWVAGCRAASIVAPSAASSGFRPTKAATPANSTRDSPRWLPQRVGRIPDATSANWPIRYRRLSSYARTTSRTDDNPRAAAALETGGWRSSTSRGQRHTGHQATHGGTKGKAMTLPTLQTLISLDHLHCHGEGDFILSDDEPYLWTAFFKVDGETAVLDLIGELSDDELTERDLYLSGTCTFVPAPGNHGNLGDTDVEAGDDVGIPSAVGESGFTLKPIPVTDRARRSFWTNTGKPCCLKS